MEPLFFQINFVVKELTMDVVRKTTLVVRVMVTAIMIQNVLGIWFVERTIVRGVIMMIVAPR